VTEYNIPEDVLTGCTSLNGRYLLSHVKLAQMEYSKAEDKKRWVIINMFKSMRKDFQFFFDWSDGSEQWSVI
jgi:hypothetical protein